MYQGNAERESKRCRVYVRGLDVLEKLVVPPNTPIVVDSDSKLLTMTAGEAVKLARLLIAVAEGHMDGGNVETRCIVAVNRRGSVDESTAHTIMCLYDEECGQRGAITRIARSLKLSKPTVKRVVEKHYHDPINRKESVR